jgi:hypothetical protein
VPNCSGFRKRNPSGAHHWPCNDFGAIYSGAIAAIVSSSEGVLRQILKSAHTVLGRGKAVIQVSYESQVMVGRVAADPQNNPAVRGYWTDHHLWPTLALALASS